jgi:hypothetical protein
MKSRKEIENKLKEVEKQMLKYQKEDANIRELSVLELIETKKLELLRWGLEVEDEN